MYSGNTLSYSRKTSVVVPPIEDNLSFMSCRGRGCVETLTHDQEIICIAYRPDGKELCSSSMNGQLTFWDPIEGDIKSLIDGNRDIAGGRYVFF